MNEVHTLLPREIPVFEAAHPGDHADLASDFELAVHRIADAGEDVHFSNHRRRDLMLHFAHLGMIDDARQALAGIKPSEYAYQDHRDMHRATEDADDYALLRPLSDGGGNNMYTARTQLDFVRYRLEIGDLEQIAEHAGTINHQPERQLAALAVAAHPGTTEVLPEKPPILNGDYYDSSDTLIEVEYAMLADTPEDHVVAQNALGDFFRPDMLRDKIDQYLSFLIFRGRREEADAVVDSLVRDDDHHKMRALVTVAAITGDAADAEYAEEQLRNHDDKMDGHMVDHYMAELVPVYVDMGDLESARRVMPTAANSRDWGYTGFSEFYASINSVHLIRGMLAATDFDGLRESMSKMERYSGVQSTWKLARFSDAYLAIAKYLRSGRTDYVGADLVHESVG